MRYEIKLLECTFKTSIKRCKEIAHFAAFLAEMCFRSQKEMEGIEVEIQRIVALDYNFKA